jgi:diguanylate cyclase (GGDEF)-like protein/PAS domain S-box-containing protein
MKPPEFAPELQSVLDASADGVLVIDRRGVIVALNHGTEVLFGATAQELRGRSVETLVPRRLRDAHAAARSAYTTTPSVRPMSARKGLMGLRADGTEFPVEISLTPVLGSADGLTMAVVHDISSRVDLEAALARSKHVASALDAVPEAIIATDLAGKVEYLNHAAEQLVGQNRQVAHGRPVSEVLPLATETDERPLERLVRQCLASGSPSGPSEAVLSGPRGEKSRTFDISATPIRGPSGGVTGVALLARDVTQARLIARELSHQATHDALTGLVNRSEFERRLGRALSSAGGEHVEQVEHVLCFLDLDGFKRVNDSCGHLAGDEFLRQLSDILRERMRARDTLARLGGDEFGILLEHCKLSRALGILEGIRLAIAAHRFVCDGQTYGVAVSIGIAPARADSGGAAAVLGAADTACYLAKRSGGNRIQVYDPRQDVGEAPQERDWTQRVRNALENNRLRLYAQPIIPLHRRNGRAPRLELLLRLDEGGPEPLVPAAFFPVAERYGLMPALDAWVIRHAVQSLSEWTRTHSESECPTLAINLSQETVTGSDAPGLVARELATAGLPARVLCFELSELVVASHPLASVRLLRELHAAGCQTTFEHSGTGVAAFTLLRRLELDYLKIAGPIVRDLAVDEVGHVLASALNQVGHLMHLHTIGFGVESAEALGCLRRLGMDYAQGFSIGTPEPLETAIGHLGLPDSPVAGKSPPLPLR